MKGVAWKNSRETVDYSYQYVLQIDEIKGVREESRILKELQDWKKYGTGYSPQSKTTTIIFKKRFETEVSWKSWARNFPYHLEEITEKTGKKKPYKLGLDYNKGKDTSK